MSSRAWRAVALVGLAVVTVAVVMNPPAATGDTFVIPVLDGAGQLVLADDRRLWTSSDGGHWAEVRLPNPAAAPLSG